MPLIKKVTAKLYSDVNVFIADIEFDASGTNYDRRHNQAGVGAVSVPSRLAVSAQLLYGRYVRFFENGTAVFTFMIEELDVIVLDKAPAQTNVVATGREWVAEWSDARAMPPNPPGTLPAAETVYYNYSHPALNRTGWTTPIEDSPAFYYSPAQLAATFGGVPADYNDTAVDRTAPEAMTDPYAVWMSAQLRGGGGGHPVGFSYFTNYFYAPVTGDAAFVVTADDKAQHWIDNVFMLETDKWWKSYSIPVLLTQGWHRYTARVENSRLGASTNNRQTLIVVGYQQINSPYLVFNNVILRSSRNMAHGVVGANTPWVGWSCKANPATAPGFTAGEIIVDLLADEQTAGGLTGWTLGFTATTDSRGSAWSVLSEFPVRVGDDLLTILGQMAEQGYIDFSARPDTKVLDAWRGGERGDFYTIPGSRPALLAANTSRIQVKGKRA